MISIIVPTYNEDKCIAGLLQSIQSQVLHLPVEIIVADNHSTDRTREIAKSYGATIVDGGLPGEGRNRGAEVATGSLLLFLDADVILYNSYYLWDCLTEFRTRELDIATCRLQPMSDLKSDQFGHWAYNSLLTFPGQRVTIPGSCIWVQSGLHKALGGFDESTRLAEDADYGRRAQRLGAKFGVLLAHKIQISVRRLEKDGRLRTALKYIACGLYMSLFGKVNSNLFKYTFGYDK